MNCESGNRVSHWRINGASHVPPLNDLGWADQILEWGLSGFIRDSDGDGYRDDLDIFIYNPYEWNDTDGDGVGDNADYYPMDEDRWEREWPLAEILLISLISGLIYLSGKKDRDS